MLDGGGDDDRLSGSDGDDTLTGGSGADEIFGGRGDDTIRVADDEPPTSSSAARGDDTVYVEDNAPDRDQLDSCETVVQVPPEASHRRAAAVGRARRVRQRHAGRHRRPGLRVRLGRRRHAQRRGGDDYVDGEDGNDIVGGGAGNDQVYGRYGNDQVFGNDGDDQIEGGFGEDYVDGGAGNDTISGTQDADRVAGGPGNDRIDAVDGAIDRIDCGDGNDIVSVDPNDIIDRGLRGDQALSREKRKRSSAATAPKPSRHVIFLPSA